MFLRVILVVACDSASFFSSFRFFLSLCVCPSVCVAQGAANRKLVLILNVIQLITADCVLCAWGRHAALDTQCLLQSFQG